MMATRSFWTAAGILLGLFWGARLYAQGTATETIGFQIHVEPAFFVETLSPEGGEARLGPIVAGEGTVQTEVRVIVHTNAGRPYRIVQKMDQLAVSERGAEFPSDNLKYAVSDGLHGGQSQVKGFQPLVPGTTVLFSSSPRGEPDECTITLRASADIFPAGLYRTRTTIEGELL